MIEASSLECFEWFVRSQIYFGWGQRTRLPEVAAKLGMRRPFVATDDQLASQPTFRDCVAALEGAGLAPTVWDGVRPEPTDVQVNEGAAASRAAGCDGVIGYGGGSSMDAAKGIALLAYTGEKSISDYMPPTLKPMSRRLPLITVPTTAGTGAEVALGAGITDTARGVKSGIFNPVLNPDAAVVDPELTMSCPPRLTASVGLDALAHALEGYTSRLSSPITDAVNFYALELAVNHLAQAVYHGHDRQARIKMSQAALTTGLGFQGRLWYGHDICVMLGELHHTQHGFSIWGTLPALLEACLPAVRDKLVNVGRLFGLNPNGGTPREIALATIREMAWLAKGVGAPTLGETTGCGAEMVDTWVRKLLEKPVRPGTPMKLTEKEFRWVFERSLDGYC